MAAARRVGGSTARSISMRVSSTTVTSLRIFAFVSTDGMVRLFLIASGAGDAAEVATRGGAHKAGLVAEAERHRFDEPTIPPKLGFCDAGGKRASGFISRQRPDGDRDAPFAEIVLRVQVAG